MPQKIAQKPSKKRKKNSSQEDKVRLVGKDFPSYGQLRLERKVGQTLRMSLGMEKNVYAIE